MTKTNKELQNTTQKDQATRTPPQTGGDLKSSDRVSCSYSTNKCSFAVFTDKNVNTTIATTYEINTLISFIIRWGANTNKKNKNIEFSAHYSFLE
jgi:hypothetical protein